jgi:hypothetical protein
VTGTPAVIATPLRVEHWALRSARTPVVRTGMGPVRSARHRRDTAVAVAGLAGGLGADVETGDVVVATEVRGPDGTVAVPSAALLAGALRRTGLTVHCGPIASAARVTTGAARTTLADTGALAVDTESAWLAPGRELPFAVVRVIVDTDRAPLVRPGTVPRGINALRNLARCTPALDAWAAALRPREVILDPSAADIDLLLIDDIGEVDLRSLARAGRIGIAAGPTAPPHFAEHLVRALAGLGPVTVREGTGVANTMHVISLKEVS